MGDWKSLSQYQKITLQSHVNQSSTLSQLERIYRRNGAPPIDIMKYINRCLTAVATLFVSSAIAGETIYRNGWNDLNKNGKMDPYENPALEVDERIKDLLGRMTLDEKTCQMSTIYGYKRVLKTALPTPEWKKEVWKDGVGNIDEHGNGCHLKGEEYINFAKHVELINTVQRWFIEETRLGIPVDFSNEGIRGVCHPYASNFPSQLGIGATWDRALVRRIGEITGSEGKILGYSNIYSPILDTVRDPRWGRTIECYGESPYLVGELGKQQVLGLQAQGVAATPKHFAAYCAPHGGRDATGRTDPQVPFRDMHEILLFPFSKVFTEAHAMGVMSSYNTYDGIPVQGSKYFLTELLRNEYGFKGYVVSDSGAVTRIYEQHHVTSNWEDSIVEAVNAGLNVRTDFKETKDFVRPLRAAIKKGKISEDTINARVADVLRVKFKLGLFDKPFGNPQKAVDHVHNVEHQATTLEAARKSLVLLKNKDNALPLDPNSIKSILVAGPGADDPHPLVSRYGPARSNVITPLQGIKTFLGDQAEVLYAKGCDWKDSRFPGSDILPEPPRGNELELINDAKAKATNADVIIVFVGDDHSTVGEARSRIKLTLPGYQTLLVKEMVKTGKPVIVVLMSGRAAAINWIDRNANGIIAAWHGGEKAGQAIAEALFGKYNPGGKLPITFPKTVGQLPLAIPHRHGAWGKQNRGGDPNGWGKTRVMGPLYHFGYGLSYTTFEYKDLKVLPKNASSKDAITISFDIKNTGDRAGDEVAQLYISDKVASVAPFEQILRGFERVHLKPGETKSVKFVINPQRDLVMLDRDNKWIVEPGHFDVRVGTSSFPKDAKLMGKFIITE
jgi:beta-glucosidase